MKIDPHLISDNDVKIKTDNGLIGYGYGGGGEPSVIIINKHFKEILIAKYFICRINLVWKAH